MDSWFEITASDTEAMLGYAGSLIQSLTPLLLPFVAVGVATLAIWGLIQIFKK